MDLLKVFQLREEDIEALWQNYRNSQSSNAKEIKQIKKQMKLLESYITGQSREISEEVRKQETEQEQVYQQTKGKIER